MPEFISLRSFSLSSLTGHSAVFEAGVPKDIPAALVPDAMAAGCVPANEASIPFHDDASRAKVEFVGDVRRSMLYLAVKAVAEKNDSKEFDGGGVPKTAAVVSRLGFEVQRKEVTDIWQEYTEMKAEGLEFTLHAQAQNIAKVIDAGDKAELLELAEEFGLDEAKAKGLQVRDLRKQLLVKLGGISVG